MMSHLIRYGRGHVIHTVCYTNRKIVPCPAKRVHSIRVYDPRCPRRPTSPPHLCTRTKPLLPAFCLKRLGPQHPRPLDKHHAPFPSLIFSFAYNIELKIDIIDALLKDHYRL